MTNNDETSSFNEALLQISRLDGLWKDCNRFAKQGLLDEWRWTLDTIWRELSADAVRLSGGSCLTFELWEKENKYFQAMARIDNSINKTSVLSRIKGDKSGFYNILKTKEKFLRILQDESGKGGSYINRDEDMMD